MNTDERNKSPVSNFPPFVNASEGFKYLGIKITPKISNISSANYDSLVTKVSEEITRLTKFYPRKNKHFKMSILPKFLYIFQSIPLAPPPFFFHRNRKLFFYFIRNNRTPRLRLSLLFLPYDRGGLQLPNLEWYYWASQLSAIMFWFSKDVFLPWLEVE